MKDEGIGVHMVNVLKNANLPEDVVVIDAGTSIFDYITMLGEPDKVIVIDAIRAGEKPGTIYKILPACASTADGPDDILKGDYTFTSLHQLSLPETLKLANAIGSYPRELLIIGIEPEEIKYDLELSDTVRQKIPRLTELVISEI